MGKTYRKVKGKKVLESPGANERKYGERFRAHKKCKCSYCRAAEEYKVNKKIDVTKASIKDYFESEA